MADVNLPVVRYGLAELALHEQDAVGELRRLVGNKLGIRRVEYLDGRLNLREEERFTSTDDLGDTIADELVAPRGVVHAANDPLGVADDYAGTGGDDRVARVWLFDIGQGKSVCVAVAVPEYIALAICGTRTVRRLPRVASLVQTCD